MAVFRLQLFVNHFTRQTAKKKDYSSAWINFSIVIIFYYIDMSVLLKKQTTRTFHTKPHPG